MWNSCNPDPWNLPRQLISAKEGGNMSLGECLRRQNLTSGWRENEQLLKWTKTFNLICGSLPSWVVFQNTRLRLGTWGIHIPSSSLLIFLFHLAFIFPWEFLPSAQVKSDYVFSINISTIWVFLPTIWFKLSPTAFSTGPIS